MRTCRKRLAVSACGALLAASFGFPGKAESLYPTRPVTLVVPFAAGGPTDVVARIVGEKMSRSLGQPVVVENIVGAGGTIAAVRTKRATPDGYTIMMGHMGTHAAAVALYPDLAYDPVVDFEPIGMTASMPVVVLARRDFPAKDFIEFTKYLHENSTRLNMGHAGIGSVSFAACLMLNSIVGAQPKMTPFQGTGPALAALVAGRLDYMCDQVVTSVAKVQAGTIKAYAVATRERNPSIPAVPTSAEGGLPGFKVMAWNALFAPKATPQPVVAVLNAALVEALADPDTRNRLLDLGGIIPDRNNQTPQALAALVKDEIAKWTSIIQATRIEP
jgi:tripartite-type tricarboxylate transporter receptor subunit TctC